MLSRHPRNGISGSLAFSVLSALFALAASPILLTHGGSLRFGALSWLAASLALMAGLRIGRDPDLGIVLLWTGFGVALGLGLAGIFSVGLFFIWSGVFMLLAISAGPNPTASSWFGLKYIVPEIISFAAALWIVFH